MRLVRSFVLVTLGFLLMAGDAGRLHAGPALDPVLVGSWVSTDGKSTARWIVRPDGHFDLSIIGAVSVPSVQGTISSHAGGRWESVDTFHVVDRGSYGTLPNGRIWTQKDGEPRVVWGRNPSSPPVAAAPDSSVRAPQAADRPAPPARDAGADPGLQIALSDGHRFKDGEQWDAAIQAFTYAIQRNPRLTEAYYQRGVCWNKLAGYNQAASEKTTRLIPEAIFGRLQYVALAIRDFDAVIARDPRNAKAVCMRGLCLLETLQFDGAAADFTRAIQLDPQYAFPYCYRGIAAIDRFQDGSADLRRCYALNPGLRPYFERNAQDALQLRYEYRQLQQNLAERARRAQEWAASAPSPGVPDSYGESVRRRSELADRYRSAGDSYNANQVINGGVTTKTPPPR